MKKAFVLGTCIAFLVAMGQLAVAAPQWPGGAWKTEVVATDDDVHKAEASATSVGGTWTIKAGGDDIWGNADQFTYVYKEVSGDFDVSVIVNSLENTNDWAKAGIMARQDLSPGSKNVAALSKAGGDFSLVTFQRREEADGGSDSERVNTGEVTPAPRPVTIRLTRTGNEFMGGWSLDGGATWGDNITKDNVTPTPPAVVEMQDPILVGIAVTSHEVGVITTAEVMVLNDITTAVQPAEKLSVTWGSIKSSH